MNEKRLHSSNKSKNNWRKRRGNNMLANGPIRKILLYVDGSEECITASQYGIALAKKTGISTHLLSKTINNSTGMNFNDYVNYFRIEEVKKFLIEGSDNRKISSIAFECGFNSISVFNSAFKKFTGTTPSAFIKKA